MTPKSISFRIEILFWDLVTSLLNGLDRLRSKIYPTSPAKNTTWKTLLARLIFGALLGFAIGVFLGMLQINP